MDQSGALSAPLLYGQWYIASHDLHEAPTQLLHVPNGVKKLEDEEGKRTAVAAGTRGSERRKKSGWKNCAEAISCALKTQPMTSEEIRNWIGGDGQDRWKLATVNRNLSANRNFKNCGKRDNKTLWRLSQSAMNRGGVLNTTTHRKPADTLPPASAYPMPIAEGEPYADGNESTELLYNSFDHRCTNSNGFAEPSYGSFDPDSVLCYYNGIQGMHSGMSSGGDAVDFINFEEGVGDLARSFSVHEHSTYTHEDDFSQFVFIGAEEGSVELGW
ncbi:hypothetical protein N658DRAFT_562316 [Parathielavia hyrcaniae]|uniref:Uncharacterized protein n=1 Tax=Parathielavia hyrcaniae TaxID=113614 RepID=A0AAN6PWI5_9PEZI|nr:hypothetical protein N658DRAFT_562316 [Parathielavia hyrcaniae]